MRWPWGRGDASRQAEVAEAERAHEQARERFLQALEEAQTRRVRDLMGGLMPQPRKGQPE